MALINVLLEFTSPNCSNNNNFTQAPHRQDINVTVTHSSFSWVQANLPAIPYQVIILEFFRGCWPDRHSLLYYLILLTVFLFALFTGLVTGAPMPTDADNSLINEATEKPLQAMPWDFSLEAPLGLIVSSLSGGLLYL
ncbi:hypothetical protein Ddye_010790 [Dipteronia dyeriana]|uniref:Uncharacterized protein n=1 Tax=Dipteronia dyeriana TaxID=168575 RepID=A0AAD9XE78_9ROSI|nr:hypothetical protein Ddye_010790 [Dipteronia dyeriana]